VGTFPQELTFLQLTGKPVIWFKERRNPQAPDGSARRNKKKRTLPHRPMQDRKLEASTVANRALGLMLILGVAVAQKDRCHLVGHLLKDAQSQVKRTKQKQKETPYNS